MKIEEIKEELETQKQINKDCEAEYRRVISQYKAVVEQNKQLQTELSKYKENHKAIIEKIKNYCKNEVFNCDNYQYPGCAECNSRDECSSAFAAGLIIQIVKWVENEHN